MSFCIKKYLVFSLRKSNNTKYYRTLILAQTSVPKLYLHLIESGYSWIYDKYVNEIIS